MTTKNLRRSASSGAIGSVLIYASDQNHTRVFGWWCTACTPLGASPDQVVGHPATLTRPLAEQDAAKHRCEAGEGGGDG